MKKRFISVLLILCLALALLPATALAARDETVMTAELPGFALKGYQGSTARNTPLITASTYSLWMGAIRLWLVTASCRLIILLSCSSGVNHPASLPMWMKPMVGANKKQGHQDRL